MPNISSKLPDIGTTIFSVMSKLAAQHQAVNLSQGFPDFPPEKKLMEAAEEALNGNHHQYALMAGNAKLREQLATKYSKKYTVQIDAEKEITITAGGTQAIFTAIQAVVKPNDEVLLFAPCYDSYSPAVTLAGGKCVYYNMLPPNFKIDWNEVRKLVSDKTKLIIFNSPHNPTGSLLSVDDMAQLKSILQHTNALLLSDEVYEHIVFDNEKHYSFLADEELRSRSFVIFSFGKTYHVTGWKIGYCIAPEKLTSEFRKAHQFNVFSVSSFAQEAFANVLDFPEMYHSLSSFYETKRNYFRSLLADSSFEFLPCKGTYFQVASYKNISSKSDIEFCKWLTAEKGVAAIPVSVFYAENNNNVNLVRFCFAKQESTLECAAERLKGL